MKPQYYVVIDKGIPCKWVIVRGRTTQVGESNYICGDVVVRGSMSAEGEILPVHERFADQSYVVQPQTIAMRIG